MKKRTELRKKDKKLYRIQDEDIEESLREFVHPKHRKRKEINVKKYRRRILHAALISSINFIIVLTCGVIFFLMFFEKISFENTKLVMLQIYLYSVFFTLIPFTSFALTYFFDSEMGRYLVTQFHIRKFFRKTEAVIDLAHHCSEMMIRSKMNVDIEFFTQRCQVATRKALLFILRMTNAFIRYRYYDAIKLKYKRLFIANVTQYMKELNGALIVSYKGRVPKYVTDVFEQINENMLELRKREVRL